MDSPAVDLESAAIDALSKRMDAMLQRMQAALARMDGAPEPIASASSSPASPATATTTSSTSLNTPASSTTPPPTTATATSSIDASTLGFPIIVEPQQAPPARCSTTSLNHDSKSSATPSPATSSLPMPASTTSVVAASSTTAPSTGASISAAPASSTELASPNISTRGEFIDGGLGASRPRRAPPRQPRPRRLRRTPPRRPRSRRPRRGRLRVPWLRRPRRAPPRPPRHRRPRRRVSQPTHPGFVLQVKGTQEVFDEMAPQQDVFKGKILNIMDHELVTVMSTNASSTPSNYISKTFAQISPPLMMLDSMDSLAHEVFVEMPDEINVEKVVLVQSHRKFSEFYRLHVLALPLKILRLFPWCYEIGVHLKHMGTRVNQNPCPPPVHFDFTACEFDVLPLTWPLLVLVKIPLDGIALSTEPSWAHVGCCQDMRLSSLVPWPSPQVGVQKFITSTVLGSLQYCKVLPWPPPMLWKSIGDGGNLQPTPWPYFGCCQNPSPSSFLLPESLSHQTRFVCNHASNKRANGYADVCISNFQSGAPIGSIGTQLVLVMEAQLELSWYVHFDVFKLDKPLRPPWPSPVQFEMQADGVRLRPAPWPFFWGSEATEESEQLSSIEQGQIMRYTVIASCYRYGVQILISVRAREVVLHFNATWVLAWLRFCWEIWISLKSYSLDFTDARQVDCTDIKFNEASYNTTLKSVLLGDSAFSGGHCGHSEEVDGLLIHMTLRSPCSYFIDDFCERDNTKAWRLEILLGQKLVARCQLTVWSVPNKSRGWQVFDSGKFKKGCYKIAVKNEATQLVEKVKSPCVLAYCSLICPILLQIDNFFRSESTSSLVSTQVMHVAILYSDLVKGGSHFIKTISEGNPVTVYWCSVRSDGLFDKHAIQWFQFLPLQQLKCKGGFLDSNVEVLRLELPVRNAHILKVCASILGGFDVHIQTQA